MIFARIVLARVLFGIAELGIGWGEFWAGLAERVDPRTPGGDDEKVRGV